jgi:hypothetical protein
MASWERWALMPGTSGNLPTVEEDLASISETPVETRNNQDRDMEFWMQELDSGDEGNKWHTLSNDKNKTLLRKTLDKWKWHLQEKLWQLWKANKIHHLKVEVEQEKHITEHGCTDDLPVSLPIQGVNTDMKSSKPEN